MPAPLNIICKVAYCAFWADRLIRSDLIKGFIVKEDDYTSNFTAEFRRQINSKNIPRLTAHSQVLKPTIERQTGTDGCMIFMNNTHFKIGLFEVKLPYLSKDNHNWDSIQKNHQSIILTINYIGSQHLQGALYGKCSIAMSN